MNKNISLVLTFRNYNKVKNSIENHDLILKLLPFQKQSRTPFKIPPAHWDKEKQQIKPRYREQHIELNTQLSKLIDKFNRYYRMLLDGEIHPDNVIPDLLHLKADNIDVTLIQFIESNPALFGSTKASTRIYHIKGLNKKLGKELTLAHLNDEREIHRIVMALRNSKDSKSYQRETMGTLDMISNRAKLKNQRPFKNGNLYPKIDDKVPRVGAKSRDLMESLKDIKSYKDIEAILLWLYSYCLQGLDMVDIANIDESKLVSDGKKSITHYYPFGDYIESDSDKNLSNKLYLKGLRSKSGEGIDGLFNLFPTLFIRDWLFYIMKITSSEVVYKGEDRIRLWRYKTRDSNYKKLDQNYKQLKKNVDTLSGKAGKLIGKTINLTRHTYTQLGKERFGFSEGQMNYQLNHSMRGSNNTYQKGENALEIRDLRHNQMLDALQIIEFLGFLKKTLYEDV